MKILNKRQKSILKQLDDATRYGKFPHMGTNSNHIFGKARMLVYTSEKEWIILIELVSFVIGLDNFSNIIYLFGNKIKYPGFFEPNLSESESETYGIMVKKWGIKVPNENQNVIDDYFWCPQPNEFNLMVNGRKQQFNFSVDNYKNKKINILTNENDGKCHSNRKNVTRMICDSLKPENLFYPEEKLLEYLGKSKNLTKFLELYEWENPGLGNVKKTSDSLNFIRLATAIDQNNAELYFCTPEESNTHWSKWPDESLLYWEK